MPRRRSTGTREPATSWSSTRTTPGPSWRCAPAASTHVPVSGTRRAYGGGPDGDRLWMGAVDVALADLSTSDPAFLADLAAAGVIAHAHGRHGRRRLPPRRPGVPSGSAPPCESSARGTGSSGSTTPRPPTRTPPWRRSGPIRSVILIAGGRNKDLDVAPIALEPSVRHVVTLGEEGPAILAAAREGTAAADMEEAVAVADAHRRTGGHGAAGAGVRLVRHVLAPTASGAITSPRWSWTRKGS